MIHKSVVYRVKPRKAPQALAAIRAFVSAIKRHEPGTLRYEAFQDAEDPRAFLHVMTFKDARAERLHRGTPHVQAFVGKLYPLCETPPEFTDRKLVRSNRKL